MATWLVLSALDSSQLHCPKTQIGNKILCETNIKQGVCHTVALPFTLKRILRQKKNYGNSNISPCKNYNLKNPLKETKTLQDIIALL
jgi:hypothetical protein